MTLREALITANRDKVYYFINEKDNSFQYEKKKHSLKETKKTYEKVILELLSKPRTRKYSMSWLVEETTDSFIQETEKKYIDVCFLNPRYVAPDKDLKPWGGKNPPPGHYNCNLNKYNRTFAAGWTRWSKIIDTPIIIDVPNCSIEKAVAEIIWEMTFYGWTEETVKVEVESLVSKIEEARKEIKAGNYTVISPRTKDGMDVVIPDSVTELLVNKKKKK